MAFKKVGEPKISKVCRHPDHNPPSGIVLEPGQWEHECPGCGGKMLITVIAGSRMEEDPLENFANAPSSGGEFGLFGRLMDMIGEPEKK